MDTQTSINECDAVGSYDCPVRSPLFYKEKLMPVGKAKTAGMKMADALISFIHLMYQKGTAKRVLSALIGELEKRQVEFE